MDYNTQRNKLIMPEYGRHVQKMIEYVMSIPDKEKRNEQIKSVVAVMGVLNPQLRDIGDFKHKLWDHVQIISDFKIDIDSPYPIPTKDTFSAKPNPIPINKEPLKAAHYGRNIQNMIEMIASKPDDQLRHEMIMVLAHYMRHQYLTWNKDTVSDQTIFNDIKQLSGGRLEVTPDTKLNPIQSSSAHSGGHFPNHKQSHRYGGKKKLSKRKGN